MKLVFNTLYFSLLGVDALMIAVLTWNMIQPTFREMGGGDCKLFINVPTKANWEAVTQTPLSRRDEILRFVANTVRREQAPSWRYEIRDNEIVYF